MSKIIEVEGLVKSYGDVQAVRGIDFYVETGKLFAFLGPNGAGKSTTIDILSTSLRADQGEIVIDGHRLGKADNQIRTSIGMVFQEHLLDDFLTVRENLLTRGSFYGLKGKALRDAVGEASKATGVGEFLDRPYGKLSGGQRRRADVARALVNKPKILFLDEPTTGLDAQTRRTLWECVNKLQNDTGMTVFFTTHYMEEAQEADYVIVIDHGLIAAKGTPADLKEKYASDLLKLRIDPKEPSIEAVERILEELGLAWSRHAYIITVPIPNTLAALPIIELCQSHLSGFEVLAGTMDDAFIGITGREMRE